MKDEKYEDFLRELIMMTQMNLEFLQKGYCLGYNNPFIGSEFKKEFLKIQDLINSFDFMKNDTLKSGCEGDRENDFSSDGFSVKKPSGDLP